MKKAMCCGLLVMGMVGATAFAQAAPAPAPDQSATPAPAVKAPPSPDKVVAMMTAKLNLTPDQAAKITPIVADRQQQMQAIRADTSSRPMQKMKKAKAVGEAADAKINAILTPDQQKQYAAMEEQMKEQMKERREEQKSGVN
jgi:Spy/CpxP family protein refolding chaperone